MSQYTRTIEVATAEMKSGYLIVTDTQKRNYLVGRKSGITEMIVGQKYEIAGIEEQNGKYTNRYINKAVVTNGAVTDGPEPIKVAAPAIQESAPSKYSPQDISAFEKKDEMMAKMNAINNAINFSSAMLELSNSFPLGPGQERRTEQQAAIYAREMVDEMAKAIYKNLTGKEWKDYDSFIPF